ncbi:PREDICTED: uncharacterized protein LOC109153914 [Ipomoea nil]|uniref:uncharacterized protein LOC109153914 n=1 Tax=Ipomoea nil TaxID=35883 RepID=UPI000901907B|nr:PREDICTED: uncharacterized protein LOC109153914 [Ipomoea nil]
MAQDRQKSYADLGRKPAEFSVGEKVWLKVSPTRGVMRFGKKGKLSARFIGPYDILERVGNLAYRLALPMELERVHNAFHVSQLKKYVHNPSHVISPEVVPLDGTMSYEERPFRILDFKTRETRRKSVKMVKVWWSHHGVEEATWELESPCGSAILICLPQTTPSSYTWRSSGRQNSKVPYNPSGNAIEMITMAGGA